MFVLSVCRMVRKRKSLPRDSRGFEPIEEYLREVEEDLNQESSGEGLCCGGHTRSIVYSVCVC